MGVISFNKKGLSMSARAWTSKVLNTVLVGGAVLSLLGAAYQFTSPTLHRLQLNRRASQLWPKLSEGGTLVGPASARIRIVEFTDFQCQFCAQVYPAIERLRLERPEAVAVVYRHFPIAARHVYSVEAAMAAECAGTAGGFAAFGSALFADQAHIGLRRWTEFAKIAGVQDTTAFSECIADRRPYNRIMSDRALGNELGLPGTPTVVLRGKVFIGANASADIEKAVDELLHDASSTTRSR